MSTSKTGKHGHAKCHFVALDIFTNRKMEELVPSSHTLEVRGLPADAGRTAADSGAALAGPPPGCLLQHSRAAGRAAGGGRRRLTVPGPPHSLGCFPSACPQVPHVSRQDYSLLDISDDGFVRSRQEARWLQAHSRAHARPPQVSLMDDAGNCKDDLKLPTDDEIANGVRGCSRDPWWR